MNPPPLPAANQRAEHVVSIDGNHCSETTGDRLVTATPERRAYAEHTTLLSEANRDSAWRGSLSNDFLRLLFVNAPRASR